MNINEIRKKSKLTQKEFADKYNIPVRTIQKWERNGSTPPDYVIELKKLLSAFKKFLNKYKLFVI